MASGIVQLSDIKLMYDTVNEINLSDHNSGYYQGKVRVGDMYKRKNYNTYYWQGGGTEVLVEVVAIGKFPYGIFNTSCPQIVYCETKNIKDPKKTANIGTHRATAASNWSTNKFTLVSQGPEVVENSSSQLVSAMSGPEDVTPQVTTAIPVGVIGQAYMLARELDQATVFDDRVNIIARFINKN